MKSLVEVRLSRNPFFFYVPGWGRSSTVPISMSYPTVDVPQRRRGVGPLSCRECRRLKVLKCNRQFPCTSCERRGCASVCPNGIVEAGRGSRRHILATTSQLQETVRCLETRISQLEEALAQSHSMHSASPHPLLQDHQTTQTTHISPTPSDFIPPVYGQSSPPTVTIASTSPPAPSPPHTDYPGSNTPHASQMQPPFLDVSRLPQMYFSYTDKTFDIHRLMIHWRYPKGLSPLATYPLPLLSTILQHLYHLIPLVAYVRANFYQGSSGTASLAITNLT
ncbi:hypothetical protein BDV93DRAFT_31392 [Ceratobasidium sp. AG-I]|nr:hypothetical protein BDV93DRAFT_31392 [Ceratobasidium sp. AG-I]